jgi:flagellar biosynthesis protein FlhF
MRQVHGLRTNQEGIHEPKPQKVKDNDCIAPEQINDILDEIQAVKQNRQRLDKIANSGRKQPVRQKAAEMPLNTAQEANSIKAYEARLNEMFTLLQNMNKRFGQALEKEVPQIPEGLLQVKKSLLEIETPTEVADEMVSELQKHLPQHALHHVGEALEQTTSWLKQNIKFSSHNDLQARQNGPRIVALIGPTGVGKTTTIAKIAASYGLNLKERLSIALFTLDTYRIGAADQLQQYAQIIDVDMEILYHTEDIDAAMQKHNDKDLIIVDTAGRCQKDAKELCELRNFLDHLPDSDKFLVLSATAKYTDMLETVHCFERVGFEHLIFTKIDETNSFGPLLAVLIKTGKSLAYFTNGQRVPDDFCKANFDFLNSRLFPHCSKDSDKGIFNQESFYF